MVCRFSSLFLLGVVWAAFSGQSHGQVVYTSDFESASAGSEWSARTISATPRNARRFLGRFGEETVNLTLLNLPAHSAITLTFDLFIIQSWDGNDATFGPDVWTLSVPGERTLLHTSFDNISTGVQAYPGTYPSGSYPGSATSSERSTLGYSAIPGYSGYNDTVYRMRLVFAHTGSSLVLAFAGALSEVLANESWGIDNLTVEANDPEGGVIEPKTPIIYVSESATNALVTLQRTGSTNLPATLEYGTASGLATSAADYFPTNGTVQFAAGEREKTIPIFLRDDQNIEGRDETFALLLTNLAPSVTLAEPAVALVWIFDDEAADPDFARLHASALGNEGGASLTSAWGDFDGDGAVDLFVGNFGQKRNFLYRNTGAGAFEKITTGILPNDVGETVGSAWADYDNDGDLDLATAKFSAVMIYRNGGAAGFSRVNLGAVSTANGCAWGDYDNDGNVDLFVITEDEGRNFLFRNNGAGGFTPVTAGAIVTDLASSVCAAWADYNADGALDLFVGNRGGTPNFLYRNNGNGTFSRVTAGAIATDIGACYSCAWGDYDNDGFMDLYVSNFGGPGFLYRNNRDGTFTRIAGGALSASENSLGCVWGDYDNDADLDLFVSNFGATSSLFMNNGNSTFTKRTTLLMTRDLNPAIGVATADFDSDGDLDIFVPRYQQLNNSLYINQGRTNNYLKLNLRGSLSNRSAIGAKVRVTTSVPGAERAQVWEISGGNGVAQGELAAHFGLGGASHAEVSITWPSGAVQSWTNVPANQILWISEAPQLSAEHPPGSLRVATKPGADLVIESSGDLLVWSALLSTNSASTPFAVTDPAGGSEKYRFYRARYVAP